MRRNPDGFTLVELLVAVGIAAGLILILSNMLLGGMQMFQKGTGHLTNLLAADILMHQVLEDLKQARVIHSDEGKLARGELSLERLTWDERSATPGIEAVSYRVPETGRGLLKATGGREHLLFPDRTVVLEFKRISVPPRNTLIMLVGLRVGTPPEKTEAQGFRRFVSLDSLPGNRRATSAYLPVEP